MYDIFVFQIALIFIPGILWAMLDMIYGSGRKTPFSFFVMNSFIFGFVIYFILGGIYLIAGAEFHIFNFADVGDSIDREKSSFDNVWDEILWSILLSFVFSIGWLFVQSRNLVTKLLYLCRITKSVALQNVWADILNRGGFAIEYVRIVDFEKDIIYEGLVDTYSSEESREILLKDVAVFDRDGTFLYATPYLYIPHLNEKVWVEFPREQKGKEE